MNLLRAARAGFLDADGSPARRAAAMGDQRRVAGRDVHAMALAHVQFGHRLGHGHADADALVVGQRDDAADAPAVLVADQRDALRRTRRARLPTSRGSSGRTATGPRSNSDDAQTAATHCGGNERFQARMAGGLRRRQPPVAEDTSGESGGHVDDPVGREPLGHVVVARDGDQPAADLAGADALGSPPPRRRGRRCDRRRW